MHSHAPIPDTALCYADHPWRIWLWSDRISGIAAFERQESSGEWKRVCAGDVPKPVILTARTFFGPRYYWVGGTH